MTGRQSFYESRFLGRVLYIADIEALAKQDLNVLHSELSAAIAEMQEMMHKERDTGDIDWLHKLSIKLKVCEQFQLRVKQVRGRDSTKLDVYQLSYFRQSVSNLIGPLQADKLFNEARQQAQQQLAKEALKGDD